MMELLFAYVFAAVVIGGLVVLARRNQRQGWRKQRGSWLEVQSAAAVQAFGSKEDHTPPGGPLEHLADLNRLQQAISEDHATKQPELTSPQKKEDLVRSR